VLEAPELTKTAVAVAVAFSGEITRFCTRPEVEIKPDFPFSLGCSDWPSLLWLDGVRLPAGRSHDLGRRTKSAGFRVWPARPQRARFRAR